MAASHPAACMAIGRSRCRACNLSHATRQCNSRAPEAQVLEYHVVPSEALQSLATVSAPLTTLLAGHTLQVGGISAHWEVAADLVSCRAVKFLVRSCSHPLPC